MHNKFFLPGTNNGNKMNLRLEIIENLLNASGDGNSAKINSLRQAIRRNKSDMADTATKSLDVLRQVFQQEITDEFREIIDRHIRTTFSPAIENLRRNGYEVTESEVNTLSRAILEGAKSAFKEPADNDGKTICLPSYRALRFTQQSPDLPQPNNNARKVYESDDNDNESDSSMISYNSTLSGVPSSARTFASGRPKKRGRPRKVDIDSGRCGTPIIQGTQPVTMAEALKWNPERIHTNTHFILGSKANKILSGGHRNQIFTKYSRLFRYTADNEDKAWLFDRNLSTRMSGRVFFVVLDDCLEIAQLEGAPAQASVDLKRYSFLTSDKICAKMRHQMVVPFDKLKSRVITTCVPQALLNKQSQQQHIGAPMSQLPPPTMGGFSNYI